MARCVNGGRDQTSRFRDGRPNDSSARYVLNAAYMRLTDFGETKQTTRVSPSAVVRQTRKLPPLRSRPYSKTTIPSSSYVCPGIIFQFQCNSDRMYDTRHA